MPRFPDESQSLADARDEREQEVYPTDPDRVPLNPLSGGSCLVYILIGGCLLLSLLCLLRPFVFVRGHNLRWTGRPSRSCPREVLFRYGNLTEPR
jgi:hypothetical protein